MLKSRIYDHCCIRNATSSEFYTQILPFEKISDYELTGDSVELLENVFGCHIRKVGLQLAMKKYFFVDYLSTGGKAVPENSKSNDLWFQHLALVVSDMDKAYGMLHQQSVTHVSNLPQTLPASIPAAAGITAFYFEDPIIISWNSSIILQVKVIQNGKRNLINYFSELITPRLVSLRPMPVWNFIPDFWVCSWRERVSIPG